MRVLTVARWYPSHDSPGRGSFVADLVRATVAAGIDARVASFDRLLVRGSLDERDRVLREARAAYQAVGLPDRLFLTPSRGAPGVPVARIPLVRRPGSGDATALIEDHVAALEPFVRRLAARWRPDVMHAHTGIPDGIVAAEVGRSLGIPVVVTEHMSTIESELADPVALGRYRSLVDAERVRLLAVSPSLAARTAGALGVPLDRIGVLPNPVPDGSFRPADPAGRNRDELVWVGSIGEHKGIDVLLEAFARVREHRPAARLRLIGGERAEGDRARWARRAADLGVGGSVAFDSWQPRDAVAEAMARAAAFVHPSPSETFGVAAAEAILTGLPVAARRSGGVPWVIELSGGFGNLADGEDAPAFAKAIEATLDGDLAIDATTARERLVAAIGEAAVARQAVAIYREMCGSGSPAVAEPVLPAPPLDLPPAVVVATGRDQALRLVGDLPAELQRRITLVVPPPPAGTARPGDEASLAAAALGGFVQALPVPPPTPKPRGRGPIARIRRALWRPPPTADQLLADAVIGAARATLPERRPVEVVAIDAPAAALVARLDPRRARLAPGALRWLADAWDIGQQRD